MVELTNPQAIADGLSEAMHNSIIDAHCSGDPCGYYTRCLCGVDWGPLVDAGLAVAHNGGASGVSFTPLGLSVRAILALEEK